MWCVAKCVRIPYHSTHCDDGVRRAGQRGVDGHTARHPIARHLDPPIEVSPRKLILGGRHAHCSLGRCLQLAARSSQLAAHRYPGLLPTTGVRRLGRADAVIAQEGQGDPESFAQFWVTSRPGMQQKAAAFTWWPWVARVARVISYGSKGGANVCVGC